MSSESSDAYTGWGPWRHTAATTTNLSTNGRAMAYDSLIMNHELELGYFPKQSCKAHGCLWNLQSLTWYLVSDKKEINSTIEFLQILVWKDR